MTTTTYGCLTTTGCHNYHQHNHPNIVKEESQTFKMFHAETSNCFLRHYSIRVSEATNYWNGSYYTTTILVENSGHDGVSQGTQVDSVDTYPQVRHRFRPLLSPVPPRETWRRDRYWVQGQRLRRQSEPYWWEEPPLSLSLPLPLPTTLVFLFLLLLHYTHAQTAASIRISIRHC